MNQQILIANCALRLRIFFSERQSLRQRKQVLSFQMLRLFQAVVEQSVTLSR
jgi:hypothetical protein